MMITDLSHQYSDAIYHKTILVLGPTPPPLGGVSVHVQRVIQKLQQQKNTVFHFNSTAEYRYRWLWWYLFHITWWLLRMRPDHVHYHTPYLTNSAPELRMLSRIKKLLNFKLTVIEHDCRHLYQRSEQFKQRYNQYLHTVDQLVLIGNLTLKSYTDNGIFLPKATSQEAAFLPPDMTQAPAIWASYPQSLHAFINKKRPLIVANAFQLSAVNGHDLYGIDLCISMLKQLRQKYPSVGLVLALANAGDVAYFKQMYFQIYQQEVEDHIYILFQQQELWPLLTKADLFVRPTRSDGASVSVQEAIFLRVPTIASDVCVRPHKTIVFSVGNHEDFINKVNSQLKSHGY